MTSDHSEDPTMVDLLKYARGNPQVQMGKCLACKRYTLWMKGALVRSCGRTECMIEVGDLAGKSPSAGPTYDKVANSLMAWYDKLEEIGELGG